MKIDIIISADDISESKIENKVVVVIIDVVPEYLDGKITLISNLK